MWRRIFGDESLFGKVMGRVGVIIYTNLLFVLFSIPVVTIGAAHTAVQYTMMKLHRGDGRIKIVSTFWRGFRENFKKSTLCFLALVLLFFVQALEITWCRQFTGPMAMFQYAIFGMMFFEIIVAVYLFPVIAAFNGGIMELLRNALFFAFSAPLRMLLCVALLIGPLVLCYTQLWLLPLWAFVFSMFGFGLIAFVSTKIMIKQFEPFLPMVDICGDIVPEGMEDDPNIILADGSSMTDDEMDEKTLAEMMKYGL